MTALLACSTRDPVTGSHLPLCDAGAKSSADRPGFLGERVAQISAACNTRRWDRIPYRSAGPVTVEEYESRVERYDRQLCEKAGIDPSGMTTAEKVASLKAYRQDQYEKLCDAVYKRRGWNENGIPTVEKLRELGIDFPDAVALVEAHS